MFLANKPLEKRHPTNQKMNARELANPKRPASLIWKKRKKARLKSRQKPVNNFPQGDLSYEAVKRAGQVAGQFET